MNQIIFFHPQNDFSGSTRVLAQVIETEYSGLPVKVVTMSRSNGFLSLLSNVKIIPIKLLLYKGKCIPGLTQIVWRLHAFMLALRYGKQCDTFYINTILPFYAAIAGRLCGKRLVYHVHEKFVRYTWGMRIAEYIFLHTEAKRIFVSHYVKQQYPLLNHKNSVVKYNLLPLSFLSAVEVVPVELRKRKVVLMMCSLSKAKGVYTFMEVAKQRPQYSFRLLLSSSKEEIINFFGYELPYNVELIPAQSNVHPYLHSADLILNLSIPSLWIETFGMTIIEAMAYGIPAIVPNVGGPTEIVENGHNGYCIDVSDVDAVVKAIDRVLSKEEYQRMAENSLEKIKEFIYKKNG